MPQCQEKQTGLVRTLSGNSGFTLAEILIAMLIFGIVTVTVYASFDAVFRSTELIEDNIAYGEMAERCLDRMTKDLTSLYVLLPPEYHPPDFNASPDSYRMVGDQSFIRGKAFPKLRFTSHAHVAFGDVLRTGVAEIVYYVQETEQKGYVLRRSDQLYPYAPFEEKRTDPVLCENLRACSLTYFGPDGSEHDSWDSESDEYDYGTPAAIGVALEIGDESSSMVFKTLIALNIFREKKD